jgi:parallel beta-helix repeat protein
MSIKDAVNNSNPGDIIEIYSGTYYEEGITIDCNNTTIIGISEELGQGNDTGKPFIQGNGNNTVLQVAASDVFITNLRIENVLSGSQWVYGLLIGIGVVVEFNNITVTNMSVRNCTDAGIAYCAGGNDIVITNNDVQNCSRTGMIVSCYPKGVLCSNNTIINCSKGFESECDHIQFSDNIIRRCSLGIRVYQGESNQILSNDFEDCEVAIYLVLGRGTTISKNNFINYSKNGYW